MKSVLFEKTLEQSWNTLENVLKTGKRIFNIEDKSSEELNLFQNLFIGAMDDAADFRAQELWDHYRVKEKGTIMDIGAGSGAYLIHFLSKFSLWNGIFCDLKDIVQKAQGNGKLEEFKERINYYQCNVLNQNLIFNSPLFSNVDIILLSNFIHCYNSDTIKMILNNFSSIFNENSTLVIHDFFKDMNWQSSLYDIHMMLNTYDGQVYSTQEVISILKENGFKKFSLKVLPSKSAAIIARFN